MLELNEMSIAQLENLRLQTEALLKERKRDRHAELVQGVIDAVQTLLKEFPTSSFNIDVECRECDYTDEVDILDYLKYATARDFTYCL